MTIFDFYVSFERDLEHQKGILRPFLGIYLPFLPKYCAEIIPQIGNRNDLDSGKTLLQVFVREGGRVFCESLLATRSVPEVRMGHSGRF